MKGKGINPIVLRHKNVIVTILANILLLICLLFSNPFESGPAYAMLPPPGSYSMWSDVVDSGNSNSGPENDYAPSTVDIVGTGCTESSYAYPDYDYYVRTTVTRPDGSSETGVSFRDPICTRVDVYLPSSFVDGTYTVDTLHYSIDNFYGSEAYLGCTHTFAIGRSITVYYGYQYSYPNPYSGGTICVYRKCDVADCGAGTLQEWMGPGQPCPAGVKHDFWKFIFCWNAGHYHFPTFNPCP